MSSSQEFLERAAYNMRVSSIKMTTVAGSGHPTTCLSAADIMSVIFFHAMHFNPRDYEAPDNDRFILSKGHAAPLLYAAWKEVGLLTDDDLLTYRMIDSGLEGHPTLRFPYAEAATGSLGMGLSIGLGEALNARLDRAEYYTYVLLGDSELSEGSVWEAVEIGAHYKLERVIAVVDCNRLGQSTPALFGHDVASLTAVFESFGWRALTVDGHDIPELVKVFDVARGRDGRPTVIIAKTTKGFGVDRVADQEGFHGKAFGKDDLEDILQGLREKFPEAASSDTKGWEPTLPDHHAQTMTCNVESVAMPAPGYSRGQMVPTRVAYGQAITALGDVCDTAVSLDAEVKNSTFAELFEQAHPNRFFQCFIAEQNMIGMAIGLNQRGKVPLVSTFSAFLTRAHDQLRMAAVGQARLRVSGSHAGVSIGQDGPSQMGLEDIAMMRCLPGSIVFYPSDAVSTYRLVEQMARYDAGVSYIRTTRAATPVIYSNDEEFPVGGCKLLRQGEHDSVCVIAAGITLHEALKAYDLLAVQEKPIYIRVIDLYSIKPLDIETLLASAHASQSKVLTVEDHYRQGGIGEVVSAALCNNGIRVESLAVDVLPRSGTPEELLAYAGIGAAAIAAAVADMIR